MQQKPQLISALGLGALSLVMLSACGTQQDGQPTKTETVTVTASPQPEETSATASPTSNSSHQILEALDAVEKQHPEGTVISIDWDNSENRHEITLVENKKVLDLNVSTDGGITTEDTETDAEDTAKANEATTSAREAITTAMETHSGDLVDDTDLDHEQGQLVWKIDFTGTDGKDSGTVQVSATGGKIL